MTSEITGAATDWRGSVDEIKAEIKETRATIYAIETKLRMHIAPAYLGNDAARNLLGSLLHSLETMKAKLASHEAELAAANRADSDATAKGITP